MFVAIRDIRFAKGRFALMIAVVALVTALIVILTGLTAGLGADNISAIAELPADHVALATGDAEATFANSTVHADQWQRWAAVDGVRSASPLGITQTRVTAAGGTSKSVALFGVEAGTPLAPAVSTGRSLDGKPGEVVVSSGLAADLGVGTGDHITLADGTVATVAGVGGSAAYGHTPVMWLPLGEWQRVAPANGGRDTATAIVLDTSGKVDLAPADAAIGTETLSRGDAATTIGGYAAENGSLTMIRVFLFAISALVVGAFFTVWTVQRKPEIAVLKALGASTRYLLRDALSQALIVLVLAGIAGALLGTAVGALAATAVPFVLDAPTVVVPVLVMVAVGIAGASLAIRRLTSIDPLVALGAAR